MHIRLLSSAETASSAIGVLEERTRGMSIAEIAAQVGFRDASYFTQYFRRLTGRTPGEFRQFRQNAGRHEKKRQDDVW